MDGENNGKPYKNGMIWGAKNPIFGLTPIWQPVFVGAAGVQLQLVLAFAGGIIATMVRWLRKCHTLMDGL